MSLRLWSSLPCSLPSAGDTYRSSALSTLPHCRWCTSSLLRRTDEHWRRPACCLLRTGPLCQPVSWRLKDTGCSWWQRCCSRASARRRVEVVWHIDSTQYIVHVRLRSVSYTDDSPVGHESQSALRSGLKLEFVRQLGVWI